MERLDFFVLWFYFSARYLPVCCKKENYKKRTLVRLFLKSGYSFLVLLLICGLREKKYLEDTWRNLYAKDKM